MGADLDWFRELLGGLGPISVRRMFGGAGFYADGRMVALEADGSLYLKTDAQTRARFAQAGGSPFVYDGKGKPVEMSYWTAPDEALDSPEAMRPWAMLALEAAMRAVAAKPAGNKAAAKKTAVKKPAARKKPANNKSVKTKSPKKTTSEAVPKPAHGRAKRNA